MSRKKPKKDRPQKAKKPHQISGEIMRTPHRLLKAYLAGILFPATLLSFLVPIALYYKLPLIFFYYVPLAPIAWGLWNLLYIEFIDVCPLRHHLGLVGALLGFILCVYIVLIVGLPQYVGIEGNYAYSLFIVVPSLYYLAWRFIVHPINRRLGIHD